MVEQVRSSSIISNFAKRVEGILNDLLNAGDWQASLFLKISAATISTLRDKASELALGKVKLQVVAPTDSQNTQTPAEQTIKYSRVFILVYQFDGNNLASWYRTIKNLTEYSVNRPVYNNESYVRELIRTKDAKIEHYGYVIVNVAEHDCCQMEQQVDLLGHPLFVLKEEAIKLTNIVEFIHANKKRYALRDNELYFLGEIES